jgi:hypothetical protein
MLVFVDPFDALVEDGSSNFGFLKSPSDKRGSFMQRYTKNEIDYLMGLFDLYCQVQLAGY